MLSETQRDIGGPSPVMGYGDSVAFDYDMSSFCFCCFGPAEAAALVTCDPSQVPLARISYPPCIYLDDLLCLLPSCCSSAAFARFDGFSLRRQSLTPKQTWHN